MEGDGSSQPLDSFSFRTEEQARHRRFDAWSEELAPLFDTAPLADRDAFDGEIRGFLLDGIIVARARFGAQRYRRDRQLSLGAHQDNYLVQFYTEGGFQGQASGRLISVRPGDVCVFDLAATLATEAADSACVTLVVPKRLVDRHWRPGPPVSGVTFAGRTTLGQVLGSHLATLARGMDWATATEAPVLATAVAQLVASALGWSQAAAEYDPAPLRKALFQRALAYIRTHLCDADLSPSSICTALSVSRPHLYRAFEAVGGVQRFIQQQRLHLAHDELRHPAGRHETIGAIADRCGFVSFAHFSSLFREEFGESPRDIRDAPQHDRRPRRQGGLAHWLDTPTFRLSPG
jgi:AraC-like DNA-binding protein